MSTANIREKINVLQQLLLSADLEAFQLSLTIECAAETTGDAQIDAQLKAQATNATAQMAMVKRRTAVCQAQLEQLQAELAATST